MFSSLRESILSDVLSFILSKLYYERFTMSSISKDHYVQDAALALYLYHFPVYVFVKPFTHIKSSECFHCCISVISTIDFPIRGVFKCLQIMVVFILSLPYEKDVFFYFTQRIINARNKKESVCITFSFELNPLLKSQL